jgi:CheY-like chemotaxis protein/Skp family chaperone for outer membrane proteins
MNEQERIETYLSSVRHDLRSQLVVVREGASMILDGIANANCDNCFALLRPALECTDELNKLIGELLSLSRFKAIVAPLLAAREEELKRVLSAKQEEMKRTLLAKEEELKRGFAAREGELKRGLSAREEELKKILSEKEEELKRAKKEPPEHDLEILKTELMGMISHSIRTPLTVVKEGLSLMLDEIPGKLNAKQKELISTGKQNVDGLIQSIEEIFEKPWNEIIRLARSQFPADPLAKKEKAPSRKRILIVEDQAIIINMLRMRLEANHYEVLIAGDGQEGLEKAQKENPDLIILDVMLPKMNGYKVCQLLKADPKYNTIPIILSSGRTPQEIRKVGQEVGADAYVNKPFEAEVLLAKIKELLEKRGK